VEAFRPTSARGDLAAVTTHRPRVCDAAARATVERTGIGAMPCTDYTK
jgi:hypothetical protein